MNYGIKLREIRKRMGLTLEDISQKTKFTKSFISQIENGKNSPSIASLKKICQALGTSISELFKDEHNVIHVIRKDDYQVINNGEVNFTFLATQFVGRKIEPIIVELEPNCEVGSETYQHLGEEFGYVLEGELVLIFGNEEFPIKEGESVYFSSNMAHKLKNVSKKRARALWVGTPPSF